MGGARAELGDGDLRARGAGLVPLAVAFRGGRGDRRARAEAAAAGGVQPGLRADGKRAGRAHARHPAQVGDSVQPAPDAGARRGGGAAVQPAVAERRHERRAVDVRVAAEHPARHRREFAVTRVAGFGRYDHARASRRERDGRRRLTRERVHGVLLAERQILRGPARVPRGVRQTGVHVPARVARARVSRPDPDVPQPRTAGRADGDADETAAPGDQLRHHGASGGEKRGRVGRGLYGHLAFFAADRVTLLMVVRLPP
mmetsp:Transcript_3508/g.14145  ORF Transcript_3508/g.14145 Transcript_3508/m.14145 type:complete len:258 (+) Transcript_3508:628-1401(+)